MSKDQETTENNLDDLSEVAAKSSYSSQSKRLDELPEGIKFTDEDDLKAFDEVLVVHDRVARITVPSSKKIFTAHYRSLTPAENAIVTGVLFGMTTEDLDAASDKIQQDPDYLKKLFDALTDEEKTERSIQQDIRICYLGCIKPKLTLKRLESWRHTADGGFIIKTLSGYIKGDIVGQTTSASLFPEVATEAGE